MRGAVQWGESQQTFERAAQALITRMYADTAQDVVIPNGRGGDGGVDGLVVLDGRRLIFQLKFFPEGFSGGFGNRRKQITSSYATAMDEAPTEWILVVPSTLTRSEHAFVQKLHQAWLEKDGEGKLSVAAPSIRVMDVPKLDSEIAKYPDLVDYATRDEPLLRRAEAFQLEKSELLGGIGDITERLTNLKGVIDSKDEHWTLDPSIIGGTVVHTLRAKHEKASQISPISFSFQADTSGAGASFTKAATRVLGFGAREPLQINRAQLSKIEFTGPHWLMPPADFDEIVLLPDGSSLPPKTLDIIAFDSDGNQQGYHSGEATATKGPLGAILSCTFYSQGLEFGMPSEASGDGWLTFEVKKPNCSVAEAIGITDLMNDMETAGRLEVRVEGLPLATFAANPIPATAMAGRTYFRQLAEDLQVIQECAPKARFQMPEELTVIDRLEIRNVRMMLEGHVVVHPQFNVFTFTLSGQDPETVADMLSQPGHFMVSPEDDIQLVEILGRQIRVPAIRALIANAKLVDEADLRKAIAEGKATNKQSKIQAAKGENVRLFMPARLADPDARLVPTPWGLSGIEQVGISEDEGAEQPPPIAPPAPARRRTHKKSRRREDRSP